MVCSGIDSLTEYTLVNILKYPASCDYFFYAKIMAGIWLIIAFLIWGREKEDMPRPDFLSCLGVSSIATITLSLILSLVGIINAEIFILILVVGIISIALWLIKR